MHVIWNTMNGVELRPWLRGFIWFGLCNIMWVFDGDMRWCTQKLSSPLSYGLMRQLICLCVIVLWPLSLFRPFFNDLHSTLGVNSHFISNVMALADSKHVPYKPKAFGSPCIWVPNMIFTKNPEGGENWASVCRKCSQGCAKVQWFLLEHHIHQFGTLGSHILKLMILSSM